MEVIFLNNWISIMCSLSYISHNTRSNQLRKSDLEIVVITCNFFLTKRIYQPCKTKAEINIFEKKYQFNQYFSDYNIILIPDY